MPTNSQQRHPPLDRVTFLAAVPRGAQHRAGHRGLVPGVGADDHVLQRRHLPEQPDVLEGAGDAEPGDLVAFGPGQRLAVEEHRARRGPVHAGDGVEAGGLARAVGPDQAEDLAAPDLEAHRVERGQAAELHRQSVGATAVSPTAARTSRCSRPVPRRSASASGSHVAFARSPAAASGRCGRRGARAIPARRRAASAAPGTGPAAGRSSAHQRETEEQVLEVARG